MRAGLLHVVLLLAAVVLLASAMTGTRIDRDVPTAVESAITSQSWIATAFPIAQAGFARQSVPGH